MPLFSQIMAFTLQTYTIFRKFHHQDNTYKSYYFVFSKRKLVFIKKRIKIILFSTIKSIYLKVLIY